MTQIIDHKTENVTVGVVDKNLTIQPDLHQVTFADVFGAIHTVFAHKGGPFREVEDVIRAFEDGTLHIYESHEQAAAVERDRGNTAHADRLQALADSHRPAEDGREGSGY